MLLLGQIIHRHSIAPNFGKFSCGDIDDMNSIFQGEILSIIRLIDLIEWFKTFAFFNPNRLMKYERVETFKV